MKKDTKKRGEPRFDLLLLACLGAIAFIALIVWVTTALVPEWFGIK